MEEKSPVYLVMVTTNNNNKYYRMIPHGDTFEAEYGRVGASCKIWLIRKSRRTIRFHLSK